MLLKLLFEHLQTLEVPPMMLRSPSCFWYPVLATILSKPPEFAVRVSDAIYKHDGVLSFSYTIVRQNTMVEVI